MNPVTDQITFGISKKCSTALWEIIRTRDWQSQTSCRTSFSLPIRKGPFISLLESLIPHPLIFEFHVGCVLDRRPPNFGYESSSRENNGVKLTFYYWRRLNLEVFQENAWFHDESQMRDLEAVADAMSQPENYEELIGLAGSYRDDGLGRCKQIKLRLKGEQCQNFENLEAIQEEPIRSAVTGFAGSLLDLESGPFNVHRRTLLATEWIFGDVLATCGLDTKQMVEEL